MQLPAYQKKERLKLKVCQESGCHKEFWGHPIAKYCPVHQDISMRKRARRVYEDVRVKNQIFEHKANDTVDCEFICKLEGCNNPFRVKVYPKQFVYPKYCEEHRNEFKREAFLRNRRLAIA